LTRLQSAIAGSSASQTRSRLLDMSPPERKPRRSRLREAWRRVRKALGLDCPEPPPEPPDEEPALVGAGSPRRPSPSAAVALELPEEPIDTDARGPEA
jgi:hypothetical protein